MTEKTHVSLTFMLSSKQYARSKNDAPAKYVIDGTDIITSTTIHGTDAMQLFSCFISSISFS